MRFSEFLREERGAITIEWVALAAGVIILALGVVAVLSDPVEGVAVAIASSVTAATDNLLSSALAQSE